MKVFVDNIQTIPPRTVRVARFGNQWCHMWCEDGDEEQLHAIAYRVFDSEDKEKKIIPLALHLVWTFQ